MASRFLDYALNKSWRRSNIRTASATRQRSEKPFSFADKKREGRKTGWKQHLRGTPVFFNLLCIHLPSSRLNTLFFWNPFHFRVRFSSLYRAGYANEKKRVLHAIVDICEYRSQSAERFSVFRLLIRPHCIDK